MKGSIENLKYIMDVVHDLFDASEGHMFTAISQEELDRVDKFINILLTRYTEEAKVPEQPLTPYGEYLIDTVLAFDVHCNKLMDAVKNRESLEPFDVKLQFGDRSAIIPLNSESLSCLRTMFIQQLNVYGHNE